MPYAYPGSLPSPWELIHGIQRPNTTLKPTIEASLSISATGGDLEISLRDIFRRDEDSLMYYKRK